MCFVVISKTHLECLEVLTMIKALASKAWFNLTLNLDAI